MSPPVFTGAGSANAGVSYLISHDIMRKIEEIPAFAGMTPGPIFTK